MDERSLIPTSADIRAARERLDGFAVRTPLVRWPDGPGEIWLKLETLQPVHSFKIRGARNAVALVSREQLARGVFTASAGNMAQGVAWCARKLGIPCAVVAPDHAPATKLAAIERLGATVITVPFDRWWRVLQERTFDGLEGHFVHPVSDPAVIAGNATIGLEIAEDLPDVDLVFAPYGGGGLSCGIAAALRAAAPSAAVWAVEPSTAAPLGASFAAGRPVVVDYQPTFIDGSGGKAVLAEMWPVARATLGGAVSVAPVDVAATVKLLVERARIVAEGAGALALTAARLGRVKGRKIVCVVSGGNIDLAKLVSILESSLSE